MDDIKRPRRPRPRPVVPERRPPIVQGNAPVITARPYVQPQQQSPSVADKHARPTVVRPANDNSQTIDAKTKRKSITRFLPNWFRKKLIPIGIFSAVVVLSLTAWFIYTNNTYGMKTIRNDNSSGAGYELSFYKHYHKSSSATAEGFKSLESEVSRSGKEPVSVTFVPIRNKPSDDTLKCKQATGGVRTVINKHTNQKIYLCAGKTKNKTVLYSAVFESSGTWHAMSVSQQVDLTAYEGQPPSRILDNRIGLEVYENDVVKMLQTIRTIDL